MKIKKETLKIKGLPRITVTDPKTGKVIKVVEAHNLVMAVGKNLVAAILGDESGYDTGLTYIAIGTSDAAVVDNQVKLTAEVGRKAIIPPNTRVDNLVTFMTFFPAAECAFVVEEIGIFGHSTASDVPDSGVMFARALLHYDNNLGLGNLTITWPVTWG